MKKCNIYKEKIKSDSLQRHTIKETRNSMNICSFIFSVYIHSFIDIWECVYLLEYL